VAMNYLAQLLKGNTDVLILSLLEREPMYGYLLIRELERRSGGFFRFPEGTLYPALHRLEKGGLVTGRWLRLANGQERRYYSLTEQGRAWLAERLRTWENFASAVDMVLRPSQP
jgi:DNA-binding PadR family transcriptional regulator